jgi:hypothetical protein
VCWWCRQLWALLNFLLPDEFDDADAFDAFFESSEKTEEVTSKVCPLFFFLCRRCSGVVTHASVPVLVFLDLCVCPDP